ncbi:MAG: hypothetical protein R3Y09_01515 [Clostridia bacterium]
MKIKFRRKLKTRLLGLTLALAMSIGMVGTVFALEVKYDTGAEITIKNNNEVYSGTGTEEDPYIIFYSETVAEFTYAYEHMFGSTLENFYLEDYITPFYLKTGTYLADDAELDSEPIDTGSYYYVVEYPTSISIDDSTDEIVEDETVYDYEYAYFDIVTATDLGITITSDSTEGTGLETDPYVYESGVTPKMTYTYTDNDYLDVVTQSYSYSADGSAYEEQYSDFEPSADGYYYYEVTYPVYTIDDATDPITYYYETAMAYFVIGDVEINTSTPTDFSVTLGANGFVSGFVSGDGTSYDVPWVFYEGSNIDLYYEYDGDSEYDEYVQERYYLGVYNADEDCVDYDTELSAIPTEVGEYYMYSVEYPSASYTGGYEYSEEYAFFQIVELEIDGTDEIIVTAESCFYDEIDSLENVTVDGMDLDYYTITYYYFADGYDNNVDVVTAPTKVGFYRAIVDFTLAEQSGLFEDYDLSDRTVEFEISPSIEDFELDDVEISTINGVGSTHLAEKLISGINSDVADGFTYSDFTITLEYDDDASNEFMLAYSDYITSSIGEDTVTYFSLENPTGDMEGEYNFTITLNATGYSSSRSASFAVNITNYIIDEESELSVGIYTADYTLVDERVLGKYAVPYVENLTIDQFSDGYAYTTDQVSYEILYYKTVDGEWTLQDDLPSIDYISYPIDGITYYSDEDLTEEILWPEFTSTGMYEITFTIVSFEGESDTTKTLTQFITLTSSLTQILDETTSELTIYMESGTLYNFPEGAWKLGADDGMYYGEGAALFYVPDDGDYTFTYGG